MKKVTYYHAGCPVCIEAERNVLKALDTSRYEISIINLGEEKASIAKAKEIGVQSVPSLVIDGLVFHINFGAPMSALEE